MSDNPNVNVTINGQTVAVEPGRLVIDVAEEMGIFVPRFCYHPGMKSVAVCRMCLVQVEGSNKLLPACATPVADGMNVNTVEEDAVDAQKGMLEFLLINHPLDCPICDRAGECPLQDQTYAHGPGSTRYGEEKRHYEKALEISDLVVLDRERCVLCWRCVRFSDEIAGDQFIQLVDRGAGTQILTFSDEPFDSYFSGNTIQICPVGALTSKPYRFVSRPWDLKTAPSVCTYCSVGCPMTNEVRNEDLVRCQALPNENVNDFWSCDKGRFGYHHVDSDERLTTPLVREGDEFQPASWGQAVERISTALEGKERIGVIAGAHLTTEDAFAIGRLARKVLKTTNIDSRIQDAGAAYERVLEVAPTAGSTATINDLDKAATIVWLGPDPKETLPVLYLRLRKAVLEHDAKLISVSPRRISLDNFATHSVRTLDGLSDGAIATDLGEHMVVCWGPSSPGSDHSEGLDAALQLVRDHDAGLLVCPPHAGSQGMIDMGVLPTLEAGYKPVSEPGLDTRGILEAAAAGELDALFIFGADPIADFPDQALAKKALEGNTFTVVAELFPTETVSHADVVLPSAAYAEREGTFTNLERRLQKLEPVMAPKGTAREAWRICAGIASAMGTEWNWASFSDVWTDLKKEVPTHKDVDLDKLAQDIPTSTLQYESQFESNAQAGDAAVAGPGGQYPKGYRQGAPFQTGQNWPLSWELRSFEARSRPGFVPGGSPAASAQATDETSDADSVATGNSDGEGRASDISPTSPTADTAGSQSDQADGFRLLTGRFIYDEGAMVSKSVALRNLQKKPFVEINDEDAKGLNISDGDQVVVSANGTEASVRAVIADIVKGSVFVPYDQVGVRANSLMDGSGRVEVRPA
ncbi:MAG: NADH-quinone oxidoreductase subunit [Actinomycetota bacterium]|nr:NADH-quinone oxidoreductase subunit [Actinomycetota bacterium]